MTDETDAKPARRNLPVPRADLPIPPGYGEWLSDLKARIRLAQTRAVLAVNSQQILLYWEIGRDILERQAEQGWGAKVIERVAADLQSEFLGEKGFSPRNLKYMKAFAEAWPDREIVQRVAAQLPWGHNMKLLDAIPDADLKVWYAKAAFENGWTRSTLGIQIESELHKRQGGAVTNFKKTLPAPDSDLAHQMLKDPYNLEFLTISAEAHERHLEAGLIEHIQKLLVELGLGFAFVGSQYHLDVGGQDYYIDLLFFHLKLKRYVVIDLKMEDYTPEHGGKMNFYLAALDDRREPYMEPSIGLILCKRRNKLVVEYSLRDIARPIGVAEYRVSVAQPQPDVIEVLPTELEGVLPTTEQLDAVLDKATELAAIDLERTQEPQDQEPDSSDT